jgi:transcriptional regulator with XRE-family HTH domain
MPEARTARNVRAELARAKVTQQTLAETLSLSSSAISRRMRGETAFRAHELRTIAKLLRIPVGRLINATESLSA